MSKLEAEYHQLLQQSRELDDSGGVLEREGWDGVNMDGLDSDFGLNTMNTMTRFDDNGVPSLEDYVFGKHLATL
jgi:hypothetical protein